MLNVGWVNQFRPDFEIQVRRLARWRQEAHPGPREKKARR